MDLRPAVRDKKRPCPGCGGSGQISFFQGESRFLLTSEECPECSGLGILPEEDRPREHEERETEDHGR